MCIISFGSVWAANRESRNRVAQWQQDFRAARYELLMSRQPAQPGWEQISLSRTRQGDGLQVSLLYTLRSHNM